MPKVGDYLRLKLQLHDFDSTKYVRAVVRGNDGTELSGSPVTLDHVGDGQYKNISSITMPDMPEVTATYEVYCDSRLTNLSPFHTAGFDVFPLDTAVDVNAPISISEVTLNGILEDGEISGTIDDEIEITGLIDSDDFVIGDIVVDEEVDGVVDDTDVAGSVSEDTDSGVAGDVE